MFLEQSSFQDALSDSVRWVPNDLEDGLLAWVDPYGKTVFNSRQRETLLTEALDKLKSTDGERREALLALIKLCQEGRERPTRLLWFYGD